MPILSENSLYTTGEPEGERKISHLIFRIWPYWPLIIIMILICLAGSYFYLKYATRLYEIRAQIVVNDETQDKNSNLNKDNLPSTQPEQVSQVEKQIEIIKSKGLLEEVVRKLNLNVQWKEKQSFADKQLFLDNPVNLELFDPEMVKEIQEGPVKILSNKNQVEFNGTIYHLDTTVISTFGRCRWSLNKNIASVKEGLYLRIIPLADYTNQLKDRLEVTPLTKQSPIVNLSVVDEIPDRGQQILNTVIFHYGETIFNSRKQTLENTLNFIDSRIELVSSNLKNAEASLESYKLGKGITNLTTEGQIYLGQVKDNDQKISEINVQINVLDGIEQYLSKESQSGGAVPATLGLSDQVLVSLLNDLFKDEVEKEKLIKLSGSKKPELKLVEDRIAQRKTSILQSVRNLRNSLETSKQTLILNNNKFSASLSGIPQKERVMIELTRDQSLKNELYIFLLQKREETAIASAGISPDYTVIEKPENYGLLKPKPALIYAYGLLIAFVLSGIWIYKREFENSSILYRSEIEKQTNVPIIGEFIFDPTVSKNIVVINPDSRTLISEQFREVRANINYLLREEDKGKMLLITSSVPNEGKSFASINLAISFALSGKKTVLVEADLYKPRISINLGLNHEKGLSDFLMNQATSTEICQIYDQVKNLWVISSGSQYTNPAELILNEKLPELMAYLKQEFDFIIFDTPCIGMVSDTKVMASYASLTLYVMRQNYTHRGFIKFINQLNASGSIPKLHIIYNGVKIRKAPGLDYWDSYGINGYRYASKNPYTYMNRKNELKKTREN